MIGIPLDSIPLTHILPRIYLLILGCKTQSFLSYLSYLIIIIVSSIRFFLLNSIAYSKCDSIIALNPRVCEIFGSLHYSALSELLIEQTHTSHSILAYIFSQPFFTLCAISALIFYYSSKIEHSLNIFSIFSINSSQRDLVISSLFFSWGLLFRSRSLSKLDLPEAFAACWRRNRYQDFYHFFYCDSISHHVEYFISS